MNIKRLGVFALAAGLVTFVWLDSSGRRYADVSSGPGHAKWVGQRCVVLKGLRARGFTLDLRRKDITDEVDVATLPGRYGVEIPDIPELAAHKVFARPEGLGPQEVQCTKNR